MEYIEPHFQSLHIVLLYDPVAVDKIPLDPIKATTDFNFVTLLPEETLGGVLVLASEANKAKVTIQSNRLEYIDENDVPFLKRDLQRLWNLLHAIQNFSVKSLGVNFLLRITPPHDKGAGRYLAERYIKDREKLEQGLQQPILTASVRLLLGTPDHYRDLRLTPTDISSKEFVFQYHLHHDIPIADTEKLIQTVTESLTSSWQECENWLQKLP